MQQPKIIHIDETDSTNSYLRKVADGEEAPMLVVVADHQTAGRGQAGNHWESEQGKNLLFSIRIQPRTLAPSRQFLISMAISQAIWQVLDPMAPGHIHVKWPNDIYYDDRKLCGILIENRLQGGELRECILGIGLNVNQTLFRSDAPNPVSLCQILGRTLALKPLLMQLLDAFGQQLHVMNTDAEQLVDAYRKHLYRRTGFHAYRDCKGYFEAELVDVEPTGHLTLRDRKGGERRYAFKEVSYIFIS
ncbi:MAG: biotin--[acetyl-CoA-carboxylase] ligase [Prevotella sp.]|nr:biotin--[acetyl-CoA-carboxylase] ligase [Prevotella sp.]MDY5656700.1 biotin--[acetyl-CoA-carboxylase] ligase [Prevotella sp.]